MLAQCPICPIYIAKTIKNYKLLESRVFATLSLDFTLKPA